MSGTPASGKGTQAQKIVEKYGVVHFSVGQLFREAVAKGTPIGVEANRYMSKGLIVPEDLVRELVEEKLNTEEVIKNGCLVEGFPLKGLPIDPTHVFFFEVPDNVWMPRALGRRVDPVTGKIYHMISNPPPSDEIAERLITRKDDTEECVKNRQKELHDNVEAFKETYKNKIVIIDGNQDPQMVFEELDDCLSHNIITFEDVPNVHSPGILGMQEHNVE